MARVVAVVAVALTVAMKLSIVASVDNLVVAVAVRDDDDDCTESKKGRTLSALLHCESIVTG